MQPMLRGVFLMEYSSDAPLITAGHSNYQNKAISTQLDSFQINSNHFNSTFSVIEQSQLRHYSAHVHLFTAGFGDPPNPPFPPQNRLDHLPHTRH